MDILESVYLHVLNLCKLINNDFPHLIKRERERMTEKYFWLTTIKYNRKEFSAVFPTSDSFINVMKTMFKKNCNELCV